MWYYDPIASEHLLTSATETFKSGFASSESEMPADIQLALAALIARLCSGNEHDSPCFSTALPLIAARAPGRLDVMGGIADYSGSTVLQLPLKESTIVFCQRSSIPEFRVVSTSTEDYVPSQEFRMPMDDFIDSKTGKARSERSMRQYFSDLADKDKWAAYVAGVVTVLMQHSDCDITTDRGILLQVTSTVPQGKGVSSSAALEVAVMRAVSALFHLKLSAHRQALLCQRVENHIVGAPCGLMDQMASSCGDTGALLSMLCQPDIVNDPVALPAGLSLWGIDSGIRHAVSGADYSTVRVAAFMGYRYILEAAGIADRNVAAADIIDSRWNGYLANISVHDYLQTFEAKLPDKVSGRVFLQHFDNTTDSITAVDPDTVYAVRACTAHPVHEHFRARLFIQLATTAQEVSVTEPLAKLMGECMYQSHASYSSCGLDSQGTDELVRRLNACGHAGGIFGARITGGGSGGVVAVLAHAEADSLIRSIASDYAATSGLGGYVFSGSSAGAGVFCLVPESNG